MAQSILQNITKQSLYRANSFACSLANRDKPVAAALQRRCTGGINCLTITKTITKIIVPRNYLVIISARMVHRLIELYSNYHYTQNDNRTDVYYFRITFGNSCSVITEPNCFWNYLVSVRSVSRGLLNPLPNCFGNYIR